MKALDLKAAFARLWAELWCKRAFEGGKQPGSMHRIQAPHLITRVLRLNPPHESGIIMTIREAILSTLKRVSEEQEAELVDDLDDATVLLESGLDSLGFAVLIAELEEELGFDPFIAMVIPVYPETLGEFVDLYERHAAAAIRQGSAGP